MPVYSQQQKIWFFGLVLIVLTGWFSVGYHHPDEHYQVLEFAKFKLGEAPEADLPWEFHEKMRPGLQPFIAFCGIKFFRFFGLEDPFTQVALFRILTGLLAFWLYWRWCSVLASTLKDGGKWLRLGIVFFWMMPYLNVRFSSENMSAIAFFGGLLMIYPEPDKKSARQLILAGFVLCLSFFLRYQIAFAAIGLGAWFLYYKKLSLNHWAMLILGAALAFIPGLAADWWLYGEWQPAPYNYFVQNIVEDKASGFGVSPWWAYASELPIAFLPPISFLLFGFMIWGIRQSASHVFVWVLIPFVVCHSLIAHKEVRFMFPMLLPIFYLAATGLDKLFSDKKMPGWLTVVFKISLVFNVLALIYRSVYPANDTFAYTRFIRNYTADHPGVMVYQEKKGKLKKEILTPHFYQTPWIQSYTLDSLAELNKLPVKAGDLIFYNTIEAPGTPEGLQIERVYRWYPDWLLYWNVNNWQDRTRIWSVYQINTVQR